MTRLQRAEAIRYAYRPHFSRGGYKNDYKTLVLEPNMNIDPNSRGSDNGGQQEALNA
jgi:hypothetical protein